MITPADIRLAVERPSKLPASASADDYQMEKYQRVAIEAVLEMAMRKGWCPHPCGTLLPSVDDCRRCWREALEREG